MKLSLNWIFDHINGSWSQQNVEQLFVSFNNTTAEIEYYERITVPLSTMAMGMVKEVHEQKCVIDVPEWQTNVSLPLRKGLATGSCVLIIKNEESITYATCQDIGGATEHVLPSLFCSKDEIAGKWKDACAKEDYIITIDNTSITHRPDLWGHRGVAREMAAILELTLVPESDLLTERTIVHHENQGGLGDNTLTVSITNVEMCDRLAVMSVSDLKNHASVAWMAQRLVMVGARPLNAVIDATNYVMFDWGQPMHAFDSSIFVNGHMKAGAATKGDSLTLLDGTTVTLTDEDCVIANDSKPVSLAGIMGGLRGSVLPSTGAVYVESAHFNPAVIRRTSQRHRIRTDASTRFEKGLDPNQNTSALMRFLTIMDHSSMIGKPSETIISLGKRVPQWTVTVLHRFINEKIGMAVSVQAITAILLRLGFGVITLEDGDGTVFTITVPSWRPDIKIPEDIVEEVARFVGYDIIPQRPPVRLIKPVDNDTVFRLRAIKRQCAFGMGMREVASYPLYDEELLRLLSYDPNHAPTIKNPVSERYQRLVTSLIPHLLNVVRTNAKDHDEGRFFEWGTIWQRREQGVVEGSQLGLVWYNKAGCDFYEMKAAITSLFALLRMPVKWESLTEVPAPWYDLHKTARLVCEDEVVGYAGVAHGDFISSAFIGDACIAELNGNSISGYVLPPRMERALSRYQKVTQDISLMIPASLEVATLEEIITSCDDRIVSVTLIDRFKKPEWRDRHSVTLRYIISDPRKTLVSKEIESIAAAVTRAVISAGGVPR